MILLAKLWALASLLVFALFVGPLVVEEIREAIKDIRIVGKSNV